MSGWWNRRPLSTRLLVYAVVAILAFVMAASVGAVAALMASGGLSWPTGGGTRPGGPGPADEQGKASQHRKTGTEGSAKEHRQVEADHSGQKHADRSKKEKAGSEREQAASHVQQIPYVAEVGEIQASAVGAFSDSHEKLLRYDTLTSGDIEEMQANQAALQEYADQARDLEAPQKYEQHKQAFVSAIDELHQGAHSAYILAADPLSANQGDFDDYVRLTKEAAADLQQSNEALGKDYKTTAGLREVNTT
jgi:hypothetical protein